ncbi:MAG: nuclear transport factor 2 family protein [Immundisolibacter sp.]|uniref:nuclear transport factor 2 family protein n=1 Tax=Immundisolibacter sp. TaxID=1934948 RepID=UPI003EE322D0
MSAAALLHRYAQALDAFDFNAVLEMFAADAEYRVQMRANFERNGVLNLVRDSHQGLKLRLMTHPPSQLPKSRHVLGDVALTADGSEARASFTVERDGKPTFVGEYRARLAAGQPPRFAQLMAVVDGDSCPDQIMVPI